MSTSPVTSLGRPAFIGSKYAQTQNMSRVQVKKLIAADIREAMRKKQTPGLDGFTINTSRGYSTMDVALDFTGPVLNVEWVRWAVDQSERRTPPDMRMPVNFRPNVEATIRAVKSIVNAYNHDHSDIEVDHFSVRFYVDCEPRKATQEAEREAVTLLCSAKRARALEAERNAISVYSDLVTQAGKRPPPPGYAEGIIVRTRPEYWEPVREAKVRAASEPEDWNSAGAASDAQIVAECERLALWWKNQIAMSKPPPDAKRSEASKKGAVKRAAYAAEQRERAEQLEVVLEAVGNPDFGQPRWIGIQRERVTVASFAEASAVCRKFIAKHDLGGGNWSGGQVFKGTGEQVAEVSYNGRVWKVGARGGGERVEIPIVEVTPPSASDAAERAELERLRRENASLRAARGLSAGGAL